MTKFAKKFSNTRRENWKDWWHQLCLAKGNLKLASRKCLQSRKLHLNRIHKTTSGSLPTKHEDRIAGKWFTSMNPVQIGSQFFILMPQVMKILDAKAAVDKKWKGKRIDCNISNYVPFVVPGLSTSSSTTPTPTSSTSSSQDSVLDVRRYVENPVPERSGSTSEELRRNLVHGSTETENTNKNKGREDVQIDLLHDLPDWLQEFRENLVDESTSEKRRGDLMQRSAHTSSSPHDPPMDPRAYVEPGSGKRSVFTHFPKDPNCEICLKTKITRASCWRRAKAVVPRAENFLDLIAADHEVLSEESESRNNHRHAVVVQDLATQWSQSYLCKTKSSQETLKSLLKFLEPARKHKVIYTDNSLEFGRSCEELSWNHCTSTPHRSETHGIDERAVRRVKEGTYAVLLQSGLNESWWADSMECFTYLRNITNLLSDGKTPYERRFGQPFKGPIIPFGSLVEGVLNAKNNCQRIQDIGQTK